jgi:hypothetical protein
MAEKSVVFSLKVNTGNSVQDIQAMDAAVNDLNQDLKATQKTAADNTGIDTFDQKLQELNARVEAGGLTMREMTRTMKEYQNIAAAAGAETPIGQQAIRNAAGLKDEIGDLKAQTTALSSDFVGLDTTLSGIETGAAAFQGIQSAVALTGVESEALTETMVKLQAVQGLVNAVSIVSNNLNKEAILGIQIRNGLEKAKNFILTGSIAPTLANTAATTAQAGANVGLAAATTTSTTAMKLFRLALISTGIGALVVAIGLLIANWDKVTEGVQNTINWFNKLGPVGKGLVSALLPIIPLLKGIVSALEFFGVKDDEVTAKIKKNAKEKTEATEKELNKKISAEKKKAKAVDDTLSFEIRKAQAAGKETGAIEEQRLQAALKSGRGILQMSKEKIAAYEDEIKKLKSLKNVDQERIKEVEKLLKKEQTSKNEQYKLNVKAKEDLDVLRIEETKAEEDAAKERADKAKARAEKRREAAKKEAERLAEIERKANEDRIKAEDDQFQLSLDLMKEGQEKELFQSTIKYDKLRDQAHGNAELLRQIDEQEAAERIAIVNKYSKEELDKIAESEAKKRELRNKWQRYLNSDQENELLDLDEWYKEQEKINIDNLKNGNTTQEQYNAYELKLREDFKKKKADIDKKYDEQTKANEVKAREESLKGVTAAIEGAQRGLDELKKVNELVNQIDQARLNSIAKNREDDLANLDANMQAQLNQEGLTADQRKNIEEKFAQQKYQVQLKAFNEEEKIKKAQFAREKALRLAQVGIDTASAIVKGIAQFGPPPSPAGIAAIASASLIGITQAMAIMNQKYQAGSAPTPPQLSSGGGSSLSGAGASSFQANTNTQTTDLTQSGQAQQGQTMTSQVVVLESDITNTQNKVQVQEAKSSF